MTSEFEVVKPFRHARTMRAAGERLSLSAAQAQFLVLGGLVRPLAAPEPAPAAKTARSAKTETPA